MLNPKRSPPPDYYANNLVSFVAGVLDRHGDLLSSEEASFGHAVHQASTDSRRLFARILSRRGPLVRLDSIAYREVSNLTDALQELQELGLLAYCPPVDIRELLQLLKRKELLALFGLADTRQRKADIMEEVVSSVDADTVAFKMKRGCPWVAVRDPSSLELYQLLFFGSRHSDLSMFVLRDLGMYSFERYRLDPRHRMFDDRRSLDRMLDVYRVADAAHDALEADDAGAMISAAASMGDFDRNRIIERRRCRALNSIGRRLERLGHPDAALAVYEQSTQPPARERRVRILCKRAQRQEASALLGEILAAPLSHEEREFASRFGKRIANETGFKVECRVLSQRPEQSIEAFSAERLTARRGVGLHLESALPCTMFALAYWDWIFCDVQGAFVNEFQMAPMDLFWPDFFRAREGLVEDPLESNAPVVDLMLKTAERKRGISCALVHWPTWNHSTLDLVVRGLGEDGLRRLLRIVRADLILVRKGFPDLTLLYESGTFEFVEVKGPSDQLQPVQRVWLRTLTRAGLACKLLKWQGPA